jgi:hypothetical protein
MTRRRSISRLGGAGAALALLLLVALPAFVDAKILTWSISADRSSVVAGVPTVVNLTVSAPLVNQTRINCVVVHIPWVYTVGSLGYTDSRGAGYPWTVTEWGGNVTARDFNDNKGLGGLLTPGSLVLHITVTGQAAGPANWSATAYDRNDCDHNPSSAPAIPMKITSSAPSPTPTPTPTPRPTPTPTPRPTSTPTRRPTPAPTPAPTSRPPAPPSSATGPSPSPSDSGLPSPSASAAASGDGGALLPSSPPSTSPGSGAAGTGSGPGGSSGLSVPQAGSGSTLNLSLAGFGSGLGAFAWTVPGFLLGLPGLVVLLILGGQMAGAALFLPVTRRIFGDSKKKRQGRSPAA